MRTAEQIAALAEHLPPAQALRRINNFFRRQDESSLFPLRGVFNATERAIRRLRRQRAAGAEINIGLEYALALEAEISSIVNSQ